jgi:hypothetical protein
MSGLEQDANGSGIVEVTRSIGEWVRLLLSVRAGGICEFDGCRKYLFEHHVTLDAGNFAQMAHIVAFSEKGPRGKDGKRPADINNVDNLMLLCPECHKLIDTKEKEFARATLETFKQDHESHIRYVTSLKPEKKTAILALKAPIAGDTVVVPFEQITPAVAPRYPLARPGTVIDLTRIEDGGKGFLQAAQDTIDSQIDRFLAPDGEARQAEHVSVFGLGPMPLLVYLGFRLSNKVPCDLYQRHRDTENWTWKTEGVPVKYVFERIGEANPERVALMLSLSGTIHPEQLPESVRSESTIYRITLDGRAPDPTFLNLRQDLAAFRIAYQQAIGHIAATHPKLDTIELFPAVPAPVAVLCGRELLPKVHPGLRVFDFDKDRNGFTFQLEVR